MKDDEKKMQIIVDADACPVKQEIADLAAHYQINVLFVASYNHKTSNTYGYDWVYVDTGKESADLYIVNHSYRHDLVVTQDIGLAGLLLKKGVRVMTPRGKQYTEENIEMALEFRYLSAKERRGGKHTKGPKKFTQSDRDSFIFTLEKILSKDAGISG